MNSIPALLVSAAVAVLVLSAYAQIIPGEYVVELTGACPSACRAELRRALRAAGLQSCQVTDRVATIKTKSWGFISCTDKGRRAGEVSNGLRAEANNRLASVIRVDEDMEVRKIVRNRPNRPCRGRRCNTPTDPPAPPPEPPALPTSLWGVDEVDGTVNNERCPLSSNVGAGVDAYILDSGCTPDVGALCTSEFTRRGDSTCADRDGHGTHVAGTVTDATYGVAPAATRHCVKVLDSRGSGSIGGIIDAISRVVAHHAAAGGRKGVVNMSLGGGLSTSLNNAVNEASGDGLYFALAAGNEGTDACTKSPASATAGDSFTFSVAAHDENGAAASFTNFGDCTDLSAPGVEIISTNEVVLSGTSMAAPHVAGAIAVVLSDGGTVDMSSLTGSTTVPVLNKPTLKIAC